MEIKWSEEFSVNVIEMDEQHKQLFTMINQYFQAVEAGKGKPALVELLEQLKDYTHYHFKEEEKYFDLYNYEDKELHIFTHAKLISRVLEYINKVKRGRQIPDREIGEFLQDWLIKHIKGTDKQYTDCFNSHGFV